MTPTAGIPTGALLLQPVNSGIFSRIHRLSIVRWTAPANGRWSIVGDFTKGGLGWSSVYGYYWHQGIWHSFGSSFFTSAGVHPFRTVAVLSKGDYVQFAVNLSSTGVNLRALITAYRYDFVTVDYPGASSSSISGINGVGLIVGNFLDASGTTHGYVRNTTGFHALNYPGAASTSARGINAFNTIVGTYGDSPAGIGAAHGFVYRGGAFKEWDFPGASNTALLGINTLGDLAGAYDFGDPTTSVGYFTRQGQATSFEVPDSLPLTTGARGINISGLVVGSFSDLDNVTQGFIKNGSEFEIVQYPEAVATVLRGVNNVGQIVGTCAHCLDAQSHGLLLSAGHFVLVDFPLVDARTVPQAINVNGVIAGFYTLPDGTSHGFIARPAAP